MKVKEFLKSRDIDLSWKNYFVNAMGAMAQGLFASLLIGTIIGTLGDKLSIAFLSEIAEYAKNGYVCGAAIGIAVAASLKAQGFVLFSCATVGAMGYMMGAQITPELMYTAGPAGAFFAVILACEIGKLVYKRTKIDILVTPLVTILTGFVISKLLCPFVAYAMYYVGSFVNNATELRPFIMGIIVSVAVGILLTLPISSAAICAMIGISGLAGGAATVGCCCQMVGFAVMSFKANKWGGIIAQGLGTSMLQMGNIVKKPIIWLPTIISSAILGPVSTLVFKLTNNGIASGMGTCGMVGPIGMVANALNHNAMFWVSLIFMCIVLPAGLTLGISELFKKFKLYTDEDLKLEL